MLAYTTVVWLPKPFIIDVQVLANRTCSGIVEFHERRPAQLLLLPILELYSIVALV
jgi:hypothetical protein